MTTRVDIKNIGPDLIQVATMRKQAQGLGSFADSLITIPVGETRMCYVYDTQHLVVQEKSKIED